MIIILILAVLGIIAYMDYKIGLLERSMKSLVLGVHDRVRDVERTESQSQEEIEDKIYEMVEQVRIDTSKDLCRIEEVGKATSSFGFYRRRGGGEKILWDNLQFRQNEEEFYIR